MDDPLTVYLRNPFHVCSVAVWYSSCVLMLEESELFIDNLLVRVHLIIEVILVDRPCATGV